MNGSNESGARDSFTDLFGSVEPIAGKDRAVLKPPVANTPGLAQRRRDAAAEGRRDEGLSVTDIPQVDAGAWLEYCRPGVQQGVYRKLRLGQYGPDARLDLHGRSLEEARAALLSFLRECLARDLRCVLVAHGTGRGRATPPVLKSALAHWLPQLDCVLAFHSAQRQHGGLGATYVLLKKSERKRQETFEQHSRRKPR